MKLHQLCILFCGLVLAGCARVSTTTTVNGDGSFSRKLVFTVSKTSMGMPSSEGSTKEKPEDFFRIPAAGYKVERSETKEGLTVTATRDYPVGTPVVEDVAVWGTKKQVLATSSAVVTKLPDGRIEYVETLRRFGPAKEDEFAIPELRALVKKALPASMQQTATIDKVTREVALNYFHGLFGPPEPLFPMFFLNPDAGVRKLNAVVFLKNVDSVRQIAGASQSEAEDVAREIGRTVTDPLLNQADSTSQKQTEKSDPPGSDNDMTPLTFAVKFPGKVVETNGILDPLTGEVYWSLMPVSLANDVKLRLVIQP